MSRAAIIAAILAASALVAEPASREGGAAFIWNASASVPIGLYRLAPVGHLAAADLVVVMPPDPLAGFLAERGYLAQGAPMLKRVLALPGDSVCRHGGAITAFDHVYGEALEHDRSGRSLPIWQGCRTLAEGEVFLMNWDAPGSFDSRYFGPLPLTTVVARALPIWTDADGDGHFHWHAAEPADAP